MEFKWSAVNKQKIIFGGNVGKLESLYTAGRNVNDSVVVENIWLFLKKVNI